MIELQNNSQIKERAILVGFAKKSWEKESIAESLEELAQLTVSAGGEVIDRVIQTRHKPNPAFFIGKGLVDRIKESLNDLDVNCLIFDDSLSPAQQRNLEDKLNVKVIDRSILILDIFASRARTAASRLQVELAQLEYTLPRLTGAWVHFSRQYGGIGAKGPGETQLEIDRRQVRKKIAYLKNKLSKLDLQRNTQRKQRSTNFKVALVGYTNAGKSTLFNKLTKSDVQTANMLFTTLDSTTRVMSTGYPVQVLFSDTVGFIKKLPHQLIESFKSTLEEVSDANLLLHVVDCSDQKLVEHIEQTNQVLEEIKADKIPYMLVYNKLDSNHDFIPPFNNSDNHYLISALEGAGIDRLKSAIVDYSQGFLSKRN